MLYLCISMSCEVDFLWKCDALHVTLVLACFRGVGGGGVLIGLGWHPSEGWRMSFASNTIQSSHCACDFCTALQDSNSTPKSTVCFQVQYVNQLSHPPPSIQKQHVVVPHNVLDATGTDSQHLTYHLTFVPLRTTSTHKREPNSGLIQIIS